MEDKRRIYEAMTSDEISAVYNSLEGKSDLVKKEVAELRDLKHKGVWARTKWYFSKSGPALIFLVEVPQIPPPFSCIPATVPRLSSSLLLGSLMGAMRSSM